MRLTILSATPAEELEARRLVLADDEIPAGVRFRRVEIAHPAPRYVDVSSILDAEEIELYQLKGFFDGGLGLVELLDDLTVTPEIAPRFDTGGGTWKAVIFKRKSGNGNFRVWLKISNVFTSSEVPAKRFLWSLSIFSDTFKLSIFEGHVILQSCGRISILRITRGKNVDLHINFFESNFNHGYIDNTTEPLTILATEFGSLKIERIHRIYHGNSGFFNAEVMYSCSGFKLPDIYFPYAPRRITDAHGRIWLWDDNNECSVLAPDFALVRRFRLREGVKPQVCVDEGLVVKDAGGAEFLIDIPVEDCDE